MSQDDNYAALLPQNANIVELVFEPRVALRMRIVELAPTPAPGEKSTVADVTFSSVRAVDIALDLDEKNAAIKNASKWQEPTTEVMSNEKAVSVSTNKGRFQIVCRSVSRVDLLDIPVVPGEHE